MRSTERPRPNEQHVDGETRTVGVTFHVRPYELGFDVAPDKRIAVDDVDHGALLDALKSLDGVEICSYQSLPLAADRDHVQKREVLYSTGIAASDNKQSTNLRIVESRVTAEIYVTLWTPAPESQY